MLFSELKNLMREFNSKHNIERKCQDKYIEKDNTMLRVTMKAKVVIAKGVFKKEFDDLYYREYYFDNYQKALTSSDLGYSIFAYNPNDDSIERIENYNNKDFESCEIIEVIE